MSDYWTRKISFYVRNALEKDQGRKNVQATEVYSWLLSQGMLSNWRDLGWVTHRLSKLRIGETAYIRVDSQGRFVARSGSPATGLTLYGLDDQVDEAFDEWEDKYWEHGRHNGVLGFHRKFVEARDKKKFLKEMLDRGSITEEGYRKEMCQGLEVA